MNIKLNIEVDTSFLERVVDWPAVPREGEFVILTSPDDEWSEPVKRVWWNVVPGEDGCLVTVEFGRHKDVHGEGLVDLLRKVGWA